MSGSRFNFRPEAARPITSKAEDVELALQFSIDSYRELREEKVKSVGTGSAEFEYLSRMIVVLESGIQRILFTYGDAQLEALGQDVHRQAGDIWRAAHGTATQQQQHGAQQVRTNEPGASGFSDEQKRATCEGDTYKISGSELAHWLTHGMANLKDGPGAGSL